MFLSNSFIRRNWFWNSVFQTNPIQVFIFLLIQTRFTRKSLDVSKKDGYVLVSVNVDLPELRWYELSLRPLLLEGDVFYQLLSNK